MFTSLPEGCYGTSFEAERWGELDGLMWYHFDGRVVKVPCSAAQHAEITKAWHADWSGKVAYYTLINNLYNNR